MTSRELNVLKSIITAKDVSERAVFKYVKEKRVRLASFCASGNKKEFLVDPTGNRRWLPFSVLSIQNPFYTSLPYSQIYAQAKYLIDMGFQYWFDLEDIDLINLRNEDFRAQDNEEQLIPVYFDIPQKGEEIFLTTAEIADKLVSWGNIKKPMPLNRLGAILKNLGFKDARRGSMNTRGWFVRERGLEEVNANRKLLVNDL